MCDNMKLIKLLPMWILLLTVSTVVADEMGTKDAKSPVITVSSTQVSVSPVNRYAINTTVISCQFTDPAQPSVTAFSCTIKLREPDNLTEQILVNNLTNGNGGLTITDLGSGNYEVTYTYDPPAYQSLGLYDLYFEVTDGTTSAIDGFANNLDELSIVEIIPNRAPVVQTDATFANPSGVDRIGLNSVTISAPFSDLDNPGVSAFFVTFKIRHSVDLTEIVLADNVANGTSGVTITDLGSGNYQASIDWDPGDLQTLGLYDLYFHVTEGADTSFDAFGNNQGELEVYDAITNKPPTVVSGNTSVLPSTINRIGSDFTMIKSVFSDADIPGKSSFTVTIKVQDPALTETVIVNGAKHGEQGLRIVHLGDSLYEAAVLWDPDVADATGLYNLYFEVTDNNGATAIDDYTANTSELTVTSAALLGDGFLLHRDASAGSCGGVSSACHDLKDHQAQDCRVCHTPHSTKNIYLVEDTIQTPNSGPKEVIFKTLGIGDPYNAPDPIIGDPNSGVMADDADGVTTGVCEVCHTTTLHHRNDNTHPDRNHNNAQICVNCHPHSEGFAAGESGGGMACACHGDILSAMDSTSILSRHVLFDAAADYSPGASGMYTIKNCLSCHVDHDIFRPDLNTGIGTRASNLRTDWAIDPVQGDNTVLLNSDYQSTGKGGVCLSCHSDDPTCSGCHSAHKLPRELPPLSAKVPNAHRFVTKTNYDAATSGHNYSVPLTFTKDGSVFNANCVKCHNDDMAKTYQNSTVKASLHGSTFSMLLDSSGVAVPTSPLEEEFCFKCHSSTSNPNAGTSQDYFGVKAMSTPALNMEAEFNQASIHPIGSFKSIHTPIENLTTMTRHVECTDCHNPHAASAGTSGNLPNSLIDVRGIDVFGNFIDPITEGYQICFKCHGDNPGTTQLVTRQFNNTGNTRLEFDTASVSYHPVVGQGKNPNSPSLIGGWTETSVMKCEDCHSSSAGTVNGPHGSSYSPILKLRFDTGDNFNESATIYALCYSCHDRNSILANDSFKEHNKHINGEKAPCSVCHDAHGSTGQAHLINFDTNVCTPSSSTGRLEFVDNGTFKGTCYVTCHGKDHKPKSY